METKQVAAKSRVNGKPDRRVAVTEATYHPPASIALRFADGAEFSVPIAKLEMPLDRIRWETVTASSAGEAMSLTGICGDAIPIEAAALRFLVDAEYAAEIDAEVAKLRLTREEMSRMAAQNPPPPEWLREPPPDMRRDSWK
jgi:hypothetical protein